MTSAHPPRRALALLDRVVPDSSPLAGDLTEEFHRGRSRAWFWWQVLAAVAIASLQRPDEIRPLTLVELQPNDAQERSRRMNLRFAPISPSGSPVHGIGGLGLLVLAMLITVVVPGLWWVLLACNVGGLVLGVAMIAMHRRKCTQPPVRHMRTF